ncbi:hypothetical protein AQ490_18460 [Wenjunlia vitaminophila]|uniref:Uncharacterized protein n=1 Tax=Wenjunlia vitaminophila TaxID=76728 RepID=A0A0T6LU68_WENVI|nr:hypothetical protein [Wenjunlia vitaminophila]KRV49694.1 hypothetical protein AQ490_18460 [Wenjunlia vitaminophila]
MPNLPEDIVDRIRALEREVHRLTTYVNSKVGAPPGSVTAVPSSPASEVEQPATDGTGQPEP